MIEDTNGFVLLDQTDNNLKLKETVHPGDSVTLQCTVLTESWDFSVFWIKIPLNRAPEGIATATSYVDAVKMYKPFENHSRINVTWNRVTFNLSFLSVEQTDAATYICGRYEYRTFMFGNGSKLILEEDTEVHPGNSVTLQCTFRHDSGESLPGIIHTHGDSSDQCKKSSKARSPTQSCVNELLVENLSLSDAGTYYCALAICGEIIFGNGTKLDIKENCTSWNSKILALARSNIICVSVIVILGRLLCKHWLQSKTSFKLHIFQKDL
uniref:Ig-like domain-containing protein n=1 Tax=Electrophorus electricus TaxID=8005 RepID=A0AAY5EH44_ELEEL